MPTFPLLRLPSKELTKVLRHMEPLARFGFSLLSNKAKRLIIPIRGFKKFISIVVENRIKIKLHSLNFTIGGPLLDQVNIENFQIRRGTVKTTWSLPGMSIRQWIDHCVELTNRRRINELTMSIYAKYGKIDMKDLHRALIGWRISKLTLNGSYLPDIQLFGSLPNMDRMFFGSHLAQTNNYQRIMLQNHMQFANVRTDGARADLNDLLASNASRLQVSNMLLSDAQLNLFLKHWIAGSNQNLGWFIFWKFENEEVCDETVIFKGIDLQPVVDRGMHPSFVRRGSLPKSPRKFEIISSEGVPATIYLDDPNTNVFWMLVWNFYKF